MRISDWSSDVCSSDLGSPILRVGKPNGQFQPHFDRSARFHIVPRKIGIRATRCTPKPFAASKASFVRILISVVVARSEEHTSELQSLMRISYDVFCLKKKT